MPLVNRIQKEIQELNGGQFQRLSDNYLYKEGYKRFVSLGSVSGTNKTRKGTPDTYQVLENGKYVFVEHTTVKDIKNNLIKKLLDDLKKCLDEKKTGIKTQDISEIVFCHTGKLKPIEREQLQEICKKNKVNLNIYGIDRISHDLKEKYKGLAKEHLSIEVDTGQILEKDDFLNSYTNNSFVTSLKTQIVGREKEISKIVTSLEFSDLIILSGGQGTGKTRIAIEAIDKFKNEKNEFEDHYIFNRFNQDLFNDLHILLAESSNVILLVDDANRISRFDYFIEYLMESREGTSLKIIATVRDYALDQVISDSQKLKNVTRISIEKLEKTKINELLENEYGITNQEFLTRINEISDGNPRLAMMAGKIAQETQSLLSLQDVSDLYENYYQSVENEFDDFNNPEYLKIAGLISFFRAIDFKKSEMMDSFSSSMNLKAAELIGVSTKLHNMELVDIYENEVVKVSDQIMATYIFYLACFKDKVLSFDILLENYFPEYRRKFVDALNPIFSSFKFENIEKIIKPSIDKKVQLLSDRKKQEELIELLDFFWFFRIENTLLLMKQMINEIEESDVRVIKYSEIVADSQLEENSILSILSKFKRTKVEHFKPAVQLLCLVIQKDIRYINKVYRIFEEHFSFEYDSYRYGYLYQDILMSEIWNISLTGDENFKLLFIKLAKDYLKTSYSNTHSGTGNSITISNFELYPTDELTNLRGRIWERLFILYKTERKLSYLIFNVIKEYTSNGLHNPAKQILMLDSNYILSFIKENFSVTNIGHIYIVFHYQGFLKDHAISFPSEIESNYNNPKREFIELMLYDPDLDSEVSYEERRMQHMKNISSYFEGYTTDNYLEFIEDSKELMRVCVERDYMLMKSTGIVLNDLLNKDLDSYLVVMKHYINQNNPLGLNTVFLMSDLANKVGIDKALEYVYSLESELEEALLIGVLKEAKKEEITKDHFDLLCKLYRNSRRIDLHTHLDFILKYENVFKGAVAEIVSIILDRDMNSDENFAWIYSIIFNKHTIINEKLIELFQGKIQTLKAAYFGMIKRKDSGDYDFSSFQKIYDYDNSFLLEYLKFIVEEVNILATLENGGFSFIWLYDNYLERMNDVSSFILNNEQDNLYRVSRVLKYFFKVVKNDMDYKIKEARGDDFLTIEIKKLASDIDYMVVLFDIITEFTQERRKKHIETFLINNKSFDDFKFIPIEPSGWSWSGSAVPMYQGRIDFLKSIMLLMDGYEFIEHRNYIDDRINGIREWIKNEQKRDFLRDY